MTRHIVLDTETTGLKAKEGHKIIEIAGIELINRRATGKHFHYYLNPQRDIDQGAFSVHGISRTFLEDKPLFADIAQELVDFINDAALIIHNAPFDVGFIDHELRQHDAALGRVTDYATIIDTLPMARKKHPGQRNSLDALCKRYHVDLSRRELHGALLDAELLADVYLHMTGGQTSLLLEPETPDTANNTASSATNRNNKQEASHTLNVIYANADEQKAHEQRLQAIDKASDTGCLWYNNANNPTP